MRWLLNMQWRGFLAGLMVAGLLSGGHVFATEIAQRDIRVSYLPLKYFFDGSEKVPPADQQGFTLNGRTFVSLRFMAEALKKPVEYDPETYSIYVGRRPSQVPAIWSGYKLEGPASVTMEYFETGAMSIRGTSMPNSLLVNAWSFNDAGANTTTETVLVQEALPPDGTRQVTGTLFVPIHYLGTAAERPVGKLSILNQYNTLIYESNVLTTESTVPVDFQVPLNGTPRIKIIITLYSGPEPSSGAELMVTQFALSDLRFE